MFLLCAVRLLVVDKLSSVGQPVDLMCRVVPPMAMVCVSAVSGMYVSGMCLIGEVLYIC